jgi:hypothetical protein
MRDRYRYPPRPKPQKLHHRLPAGDASPLLSLRRHPQPDALSARCWCWPCCSCCSCCSSPHTRAHTPTQRLPLAAAAVSIALRKVHRAGSTGPLRASQTLNRRRTARGRPADRARSTVVRFFVPLPSVHGQRTKTDDAMAAAVLRETCETPPEPLSLAHAPHAPWPPPPSHGRLSLHRHRCLTYVHT